MELITDINTPLKLNRPVITIGTFDGVHIGHQAILRELLSQAKSREGDSVVVTFHPHPRIALGQQVYLLNTRDEKRAVFEASGVTHLIEIPFNLDFSKISAEGFIKLIVRAIQPELLVIGYDHGFGHNRSGGLSQLYNQGKAYGFRVIQVEELVFGRNKVSSSVIRWLLQEGDVEDANSLLGNYYEITGHVVRGNQIGKLIGYPTANLYIEDPNKLIPSMGVYASFILYKGQKYQGMTNIGLRPTINAHKLTFETNIFDFNEDIYYETITVQLVKRIRNEKKFGNLDMLKIQLKADKENALALLMDILRPPGSLSGKN